jgi:hypothetical protein
VITGLGSLIWDSIFWSIVFFVFHHFFLDLLIGVYFYCLIMMFIGFVHVFSMIWDGILDGIFVVGFLDFPVGFI